MTKNISLIGMPGAGKSAVGQALASRLGWEFIDTDRQIEEQAGTSLQQLLDDQGYLALRQLEEAHILSLSPSNAVISTGGSVVYSKRGMEHLREVSTVVFLDVDLTTVKRRVRNFGQRGIASAEGQTLDSIFAERLPLYQSSANLKLSNSQGSAARAATEIVDRLGL